MTQEQIKQITEGLFDVYKIDPPTTEISIKILTERLGNKDYNILIDAILAMSSRQDLKICTQVDLLNCLDSFYYLEKLKKPASPKVSYKYTGKIIEESYLRFFNPKDSFLRTNKGRCYQLFLDLLHFKKIKKRELTNTKTLYLKIENAIQNLILYYENLGTLKTEKTEKGLRLVVKHDLIKEDMQKIIDKAERKLNIA